MLSIHGSRALCASVLQVTRPRRQYISIFEEGWSPRRTTTWENGTVKLQTIDDDGTKLWLPLHPEVHVDGAREAASERPGRAARGLAADSTSRDSPVSTDAARSSNAAQSPMAIDAAGPSEPDVNKRRRLDQVDEALRYVTDKCHRHIRAKGNST